MKNLEIINSGEPVLVDDTMQVNISDKAKSENSATTDAPKTENANTDVAETVVKPYMDATDDKLLSIAAGIERLTNIVENSDIRKDRSYDKMIAELSALDTEIAKIKHAQDKMKESIADLSRVGDSVFDLKNAQQGMKTAMQSMENSVSTLKKKLVSCIMLLCVLSFLVVVMQILNLFS